MSFGYSVLGFGAHTRPAAAGSGFLMETAQEPMPLTDGNFDITTAVLSGATPDFVLGTVSLATANGTPVADGMLCVFMSDGTNHRCLCVNSEDAVGTSDTAYNMSVANIIELIETAGSSTVTATATFVSFIADGVRLNIAVASEPSAAYLINCLFVTGSSAVSVETVNPSESEDGTVNLTTLGETANIAFTFMSRDDFAEVGGVNAGFTFGMYAYDGSTATQGVVAMMDINNQVASSVIQEIHNDRAAMRVNTVAGNWGEFEFSAHASGATVTSRAPASASASKDFAIGLISVPVGVATFVGTILSPTSAGTLAVTAPGFPAQATVHCATRHTALNTQATSGADVGAFWIGFATPAAEYGAGYYTEESADPTVVKSLVNTKAIHVLEADTVGDEHVANIDSFGGTGFTPDHTVVDGVNQFYSIYLAVEDA